MPDVDQSLVGVLIGGISALAGAVGVMWAALRKSLDEAKKDCAEDRQRLWALIHTVAQLERRKGFAEQMGVDQNASVERRTG